MVLQVYLWFILYNVVVNKMERQRKMQESMFFVEERHKENYFVMFELMYQFVRISNLSTTEFGWKLNRITFGNDIQN